MKRRYTQADLSYEAAQVKRQLLGMVRRGELKKLNKQDVFHRIATRPRIGLKSGRILWDEPWVTYLNPWYSTLELAVNDLLTNPNTQMRQTAAGQSGKPNIGNLEQELADLRRMVDVQRRMLDQLRVENEELRLANLSRTNKIDR